MVNPFADSLTFLDDKTRTRRDHMKYLTLIQAIALLHQHQRRIRTVEHQGRPVRYIEVEACDIALANHLAHEMLGPHARRAAATDAPAPAEALHAWVGRGMPQAGAPALGPISASVAGQVRAA